MRPRLFFVLFFKYIFVVESITDISPFLPLPPPSPSPPPSPPPQVFSTLLPCPWAVHVSALLSLCWSPRPHMQVCAGLEQEEPQPWGDVWHWPVAWLAGCSHCLWGPFPAGACGVFPGVDGSLQGVGSCEESSCLPVLSVRRPALHSHCLR